jgi:hypothetical protein
MFGRMWYHCYMQNLNVHAGVDCAAMQQAEQQLDRAHAAVLAAKDDASTAIRAAAQAAKVSEHKQAIGTHRKRSVACLLEIVNHNRVAAVRFTDLITVRTIKCDSGFLLAGCYANCWTAYVLEYCSHAGRTRETLVAQERT